MPKCDETKLIDDAMHYKGVPKRRKPKSSRRAQLAAANAARLAENNPPESSSAAATHHDASDSDKENEDVIPVTEHTRLLGSPRLIIHAPWLAVQPDTSLSQW